MKNGSQLTLWLICSKAATGLRLKHLLYSLKHLCSVQCAMCTHATELGASLKTCAESGVLLKAAAPLCSDQISSAQLSAAQLIQARLSSAQRISTPFSFSAPQLLSSQLNIAIQHKLRCVNRFASIC